MSEVTAEHREIHRLTKEVHMLRERLAKKDEALDRMIASNAELRRQIKEMKE